MPSHRHPADQPVTATRACRRVRARSRPHPVEALEARRLLSLTAAPSVASATVAVGDFNRDGRDDIAQVGPGVDGLQIRLAQPDGSLALWREYLPGAEFDSIAAGDFDHDGKLDLAVVRPHREGLTQTGLAAVLLGRGDGQFTLNSTSIDAEDPIAIAAADLDDDGAIDLITANGTGGVSVRNGRGDGTFAAPTRWSNLPSAITQIAVGDISGDGLPDVVASGAANGTLAVLINHGPGQLPAIVTTAVDGAPGLLALTDVDHDGKLDVVATDASWGPRDPNVLSVYRNLGFNTFEGYGHFRASTDTAALALSPAGDDADGVALVARIGADLTASQARLPRPRLLGLSVPANKLVIDPRETVPDRTILLTIPTTGGPDRRASFDWGDGPTELSPLSSDGGSNYRAAWSGPADPAPGSHPLNVVVRDFTTDNELARASGTLTVVRALDLRGESAPIAAREGVSLRAATVASFGAPRADATADQFDVWIDWGDGPTPQPLPGSVQAVTFPDAPDPNTGQIVPGFTLFQVQGWHTYLRPGDYRITVTVVDRVADLGRTATAAAHVEGWPLLVHPPDAPVTATAGASVAPAVLAVIEQGGMHTPSDYHATISWGDGSAPSAGQVFSRSISLPEAPYPSATFTVGADHVYDAPGTYTYTVSLTGREGETAEFTGTITVAAPPVTVPLTAALDPASDSGASDQDGITNVRQPVYRGTASPGAVVTIAGLRLDGGTGPIVLGEATADADGRWSLTAPTPLADGRYTFGLTARDASGARLPSLGLRDLVIDTVAPRVVGAALTTRRAGGVLVFQDDRSGLDPATLASPSGYELTRKISRGTGPSFHASSVTVGQATPLGTRAVTLAFRAAGRLRSASYTLGTRPGTIADLAGNALDGTFRGTFPSGGGGGGSTPGGNRFLALFRVDARGRARGPLAITAPTVQPSRQQPQSHQHQPHRHRHHR